MNDLNALTGLVRRCVEDYDMIAPGDTVAVGVSGGNHYPIVLVHGLFGWGGTEVLGLNYWGGLSSLRDILNNAGYEVYTPSIGRSAHREQIHLILAGEGPREDHYHHLAEKYGVDMEIAFFSRQDLLNLLRCADLYCHPAEVEIESIACLEAIACGLVPVIADSPKSAAKAFALDEKSLFKNKDPEDMAAKIDYWVVQSGAVSQTMSICPCRMTGAAVSYPGVPGEKMTTLLCAS